jgi:hypothetical protein
MIYSLSDIANQQLSHQSLCPSSTRSSVSTAFSNDILKMCVIHSSMVLLQGDIGEEWNGME